MSQAERSDVPTADIAPVVGNNGRSHQLRQLQVKHPGFWMTSYFEMKEAANRGGLRQLGRESVSYTHLRAHETPEQLVCRLLLENKKATNLAGVCQLAHLRSETMPPLLRQPF